MPRIVRQPNASRTKTAHPEDPLRAYRRMRRSSRILSLSALTRCLKRKLGDRRRANAEQHQVEAACPAGTVCRPQGQACDYGCGQKASWLRSRPPSPIGLMAPSSIPPTTHGIWVWWPPRTSACCCPTVVKPQSCWRCYPTSPRGTGRIAIVGRADLRQAGRGRGRRRP